MADDTRPGPNVARPETPVVLHGPGEMAARMRVHDWSAAPIGRPETWSQPLRTLVGVMLASGQPMFLAWGPERTWLYNDAFVPILGRKHPDALGRPSREVWSEAWDVLEPMFDGVFAGRPVHMSDISLMLDRRGRLEEAHFAFSYTPARDEGGAVVGLFGVCMETTEQVSAERRREAAVERQRRMFQRAPGFIAVLRGPDHVFEFVNDAYVRLVGDRQLIGSSVREAFPDIAGQGFYELLDQVYATGERYIAHHVPVLLRPQGALTSDEFHLDFIYEPIPGDDGRTVGIFVEGHDVTEAHRIQLEVQANERRQALLVELGDRFRELDDPADLSFAAAELLGRALGVSRAGYGTVDKAAETISIERDWNAPGIKSLAGLLHFRDYGSYIEDLKRGDTVVFADAYTDPRTCAYADRLKAISAQAAINMPVTEQGGFVALLYLNHETARDWPAEELAFVREVAERTRAAVERRRAEKDLLALTASLERQVADRTEERDRVWRNSPDLLAVLGADGVFRAVNPAWRAILGYPPEKIAGVSFLEFVWPEDADRSLGGLRTAASGRDLTGFENRFRHKDGSPRWISWHTSLEGDLVYAYGRDVTAEKLQAEALRMAEEALRQSQKLEAMGQLTGGVAHDFNNLLTPIIGSLDLLQRRGVGGTREQGWIDGALQAAERAKTLVQRLLAFARRQPLQAVAVDVGALVTGMANLVASTTGPQVKVLVEVSPDTPSALADPNQLEMAVLNLSVNARDAMPNGGTLTISAGPETVGAGHPANATPGEYVRLSVADTGAGMDEATLARAVEPFFSTKGVGKGTGLGLSMVHGLVAQLGGALTIASRPGEGARIDLLLPVSAEPARAGARGSGEQPGPNSCGTALLVDDEDLVRRSTAAMLAEMGYEVVEVTSAEEALARVEGGLAVDLLITDHLMPGMSGVELARAVRRRAPQLPVLIISGYAEAEGIAPDLPRLEKPFRHADLAARLAALTGGVRRP